MEYPPLVWMGTAQSHLQYLNNVQPRALDAIGPGGHLAILAIRHNVASLACPYTRHCLPGPEQLFSVLPQRNISSTSPRTRSEHGSVSGHDHQLCSPGQSQPPRLRPSLARRPRSRLSNLQRSPGSCKMQ